MKIFGKKMEEEQRPPLKGLRKVAAIPVPCRHPEHNPPQRIALTFGVYEYTCPGCGQTKRFTVSPDNL